MFALSPLAKCGCGFSVCTPSSITVHWIQLPAIKAYSCTICLPVARDFPCLVAAFVLSKQHNYEDSKYAWQKGLFSLSLLMMKRGLLKCNYRWMGRESWHAIKMLSTNHSSRSGIIGFCLVRYISSKVIGFCFVRYNYILQSYRVLFIVWVVIVNSNNYYNIPKS